MRRLAIRSALLLALLGAFAWAQVDTGMITGVVRDHNGGLVPSAGVNIVNTGTGYRLSLATNTDGLYVSPPLPAGRYRVEVSHPGFRTAAKEFQLNIGERPSVDFVLELGAVTESVNVQAVAPMLQTENTTLSTLRSESELSSLPINERNFAEFIRFSPGAVPAQANKQNLALSQERGNVSNAVNGSQFGDNNFLVDGLQDNNNHQGWGLINYPELDAINQYSVETSVPDARFGRSGATVNVAYKSGTSQFHGDAFEYLRNSALDARNFFATGAKPPLKRNDYGGTFGGPLGGKNAHTFFFLSYEGQRTRPGLTFLSTVPTAAMRTGDFSQLLAGSRPTVIYNPLTTRPNPAGSGIVRDPFPQNQIPASFLNPSAQQLIDLYPQPNLSGLANNYLLNPVDQYDTDQGSVKIDRDFDNGSRALFRLTRAASTVINSRALGPQATPYLNISIPVTQGVLSYTHIFSPHLFNEARFGISREAITSFEAGVQNTAQAIGIPNVNIDSLTKGLPIVAVSGMTTIGAKDHNPAIIVSQNTEWGDNLDAVLGNHNLKTGFDVVFRQANVYQSSYSRGEFDFSTIYTNNPAVSGITGFGAADLLLGKPQDILLDGLIGTRGLRRSDWAFFAQDDWKISPRLTLNLGLRYELPLGYPNTEVANRMEQFDIATGFPVPVDAGQYPWRSGIPTDRNAWAPRIGASYRLGNSTVVRAAYGIFYSLIPIPLSNTLAANPPLFLNSKVTNDQADFEGARSISDGPLRTTDPNAPGQSYYGIATDFRVPLIQEWNLAIQRQFPGQQQLTVAYVGTKGTHLTAVAGGGVSAVNFNQAIPGTGAVNLRRRWPNDGTVSIYQSDFDSIYHSLQVMLVKRWANALSYQIAYTYSHLIDNLDPSNLPIFNLSGARGNGDYDIRHQLRGTFSYELPFGRGKTLLANSSRLVNALAGGWQINGVLSLYTGFPFSVIAAANTLNIGEGSYPNRLANGNLPAGQRTLQHWFDVSAFTNPGFQQWGNAGRNILWGPHTTQLDASLFKTFTIRERQHLEFRVETFNLTNTPQLNPPINTLGSPNSGSITSAGSDATLQRTERQVQLAIKYLF
ncbi:MAG TPA: carboxypeptidase regulatory-like domain-containing protein [Bryobacteraceae bacterium]|nr:carboxypeptidase regulatory-like domain-containing protein [Bryobacteraceae bacterium]